MGQSKSTGHKRYGKYRERCAKYWRSGNYLKNKLRKWRKNNVGKDWTHGKIKQEEIKFINMQKKKIGIV